MFYNFTQCKAIQNNPKTWNVDIFFSNETKGLTCFKVGKWYVDAQEIKISFMVFVDLFLQSLNVEFT